MIQSLFIKGKFAKFKRYTGHSAHVTRVRWTWDSSYLISIGGRDVAILIWKHERNTNTDILSTTQTKTTVKSISATPTTTALPVRQGRGESDDSDNTDSEEEGYDSDVQHDRSMDYNTRILIKPVQSKKDKKEILRPSTATNKKPL